MLDCAHGATYHVAPAVFRELGADIIEMGVSPDGFNINEGVGATAPQALAERVVAERADLGIAFDGDGDRVVMVDAEGSVVDGDELLYIIARHRRRARRLVGGVVGTVMTNLGMEAALREQSIDFARAKVGDRYVLAECESRGWQLGGESSGHILCLDVHSTGDGIVSALQVLNALVEGEESLGQARAELERFPQVLINVRAAEPARFREFEPIVQAISRVERELGEGGRVLVRPSGTEPLVRVMVEGRDGPLIERHARAIAEVVGAQMG